jgi:hypothetical protein
LTFPKSLLTDGIDETLVNYSSILALGRPQKRDYMSLFNWVWNNKPLDEGYFDFSFHIEDFVSAAGRSEQGNSEKSKYFESCIQSYFSRYPKSPFKVRNLLAESPT